MELKYKIKAALKAPYTFKSHLYGIEIAQYCPVPCWRHRLNRTFMELKFCLVIRNQFSFCCLNRTFMELKLSCMYLSSASAKLFKSHLYGIEISYGLRMLCHLLDFFIAPLWNNDDLYSTWYCGGWRPPLLIGS